MTASRQLISMRGSSAVMLAASARSASACNPSLLLSGLPGVSSHQTRSSCNRLSANRLTARWAACGGLKDPPSRPMRMPLVWNGIAWAAVSEATETDVNGITAKDSRPRLPGAVDAIFEAGQLLGANRATGVELTGG